MLVTVRIRHARFQATDPADEHIGVLDERADGERDRRHEDEQQEQGITVTASARLPWRVGWTRSVSGQVATTIIVAQTVASKNGRSTQKLPAINPPIASTARMVRERSRGMSTMCNP